MRVQVVLLAAGMAMGFPSKLENCAMTSSSQDWTSATITSKIMSGATEILAEKQYQFVCNSGTRKCNLETFGSTSGRLAGVGAIHFSIEGVTMDEADEAGIMVSLCKGSSVWSASSNSDVTVPTFIIPDNADSDNFKVGYLFGPGSGGKPSSLYHSNQNAVDITPACDVSDCLRCVSDDAKECGVCQASYTLSGDGLECEPDCKGSITECDICDTPSVCDTCNTGFEGDNCVQIDCSGPTGGQCALCASAQECDTCNPGFEGPLCTAIECPAVENCDVCASSVECKTCKGGYTLSKTGDACTKAVCAIDNCDVCQSPVICETCADFYVPAQRGSVCEARCGTYCTSCAGENVCDACLDTYIIVEGQCVSNSTNDSNNNNTKDDSTDGNGDEPEDDGDDDDEAGGSVSGAARGAAGALAVTMTLALALL